MIENRISELLDRFLRDQCTVEEKEALFARLRQMNDKLALQALLEEAWNHYTLPTHTVPDERVLAILDAVRHDHTITLPQRRNRFMGWRIAAAAAVLGLLATGAATLFLSHKKTLPLPQQTLVQMKPDIAPPKTSKAVLTLANGKSILLDSAAKGILATQGSIRVQKNSSGGLVYAGGHTGSGTVPAGNNTLTVPSGSQPVQLTLADGSKVWLDAASSLTYPAAFTGGERKVSLTGEAYFEIAQNAAVPFIVKSGEAAIQVLGTHFNVSAYQDDRNMKVTLLQGLVRVSQLNNHRSQLIKPGEQAQVDPAGRITLVKDADIEEAVAWKNGLFIFNRESLSDIMKKLSRWYNVEVVYKPGVDTGFHFTGTVQRYENITGILRLIEMTREVKFEISGNKVEVSPL